MIPRRVRLAALLAFLGHGFFILTARYRLTYDAYNHMFFGDHYARSWWSLWEPRWFGGFEIVSYPPLVHQSIGLAGRLIGVDAAYALIAWLVLSLYPLAIYAFSRAFFGRAVSSHAALGGALLSSIYYAAHAFGQLPTLAATLLSLFGLAALDDFLRRGNGLSGALSVLLVTTMMAAHHGTLLFLPWGGAAVTLNLLLNKTMPVPKLFGRLLVFAAPAILGGLLVIWPFWVWGAAQSMQTPIDHLSRHNFFSDRFAFVAFFLPMYGPLVVFIPTALWLGRSRRCAGLVVPILLLMLLGLGGTTPLPRWLFGAGWEWLTYDRFAFWATLLLLPLFGVILVQLRRRLPGQLALAAAITAQRFRRPWVSLQKAGMMQPRRWALNTTLAVFAVVALASGLVPELYHTQPPPLDMRPIVEFLEIDDRSTWRYLTFGFGDQLAYLSRLTEATTIDGSYFTARRLPELRTSGIGQIDMALWSARGLPALDPILRRSDERGVRWGFVNRREYIPVLRRNGWEFVRVLTNGVQVWEDPAAVLPAPAAVPSENPLASFSWGTLPILSLLATLALAGLRLRPRQSVRVLEGLHAFLVGLLPVALCFWYFRTLAPFPHSRVYFTYSDALIFVADAALVLAVLAWGLRRVAGPSAPAEASRDRPIARPMLWFFALCALATFSALWSKDWRLSLYFALHLWLVLGLFLSLRDWPSAWRAAALGLCAALALQLTVGVIELLTQSTILLEPLGLEWPGRLDRSVSGAGILMTMSGAVLLRLYGLMPHPNILGAFGLVLVAGPAALFLRPDRPNRLAVVLFAAGCALIGLTFSRAAWLGLAALCAVLVWKSRLFESGRVRFLLFAGALALLLVLLPLREFVFARVSAPSVQTEQLSIYSRQWLASQALDMLREQPITGVGAGSFALVLAERAVEGAPIEPVHSLPLLIAAELGLPGLVILIGLGATAGRALFRTQNPRAALIGAALVGLAVCSLFDHTLWSLAPGRILSGLVLGLWAGQLESNELTLRRRQAKDDRDRRFWKISHEGHEEHEGKKQVV